MSRIDLDDELARLEAMSLGEVDSVMQHVQLRKWLRVDLGLPVLLHIVHHASPCVNVG